MRPGKGFRPFVRKWAGRWIVFMGRSWIILEHHGTHRDAMHAARQIAITEANR